MRCVVQLPIRIQITLGGRPKQRAALGIIGILGDDRKSILLCELPDRCVRRASQAAIDDVPRFRVQILERAGQAKREVLVE